MNIRTILATICVATAASFAITGCSGKGEADTSIAFETVQRGAAYTLDSTAQVFDQQTDVVFSDSVSLLMPTHLGACDPAELRAEIMRTALDTAGIPMDQALSLWLDKTAASIGFKTTPAPASAAADSIFSGFCYVYGYVVNLSPELLVYCVQQDLYQPGAAHGMAWHNYINYSLENGGSIITLQSIFTPEGLSKLPARIAEQAEALSDRIGPTQITELPAGGNFYISSEGEIVFSFQPYEVASYAQGTIDIPFFPYELYDYMTPRGITLFRLSDI